MSKQLESAVLAVLFAVGEPLSPARLAEALEQKEEVVHNLLEHLRDTLETQRGAFQILNLGGQYQMATREEHTELIRRVINQRRNVPLTPAALEVLAAVAYNQPVTRAYVEQVRGIDSSSIIASLVEKGLLEEAGRLELPGRPICYQTTPNFLRTFGLSSLAELPLTEPEPEEELLDEQIEFDDSVEAAAMAGR